MTPKNVANIEKLNYAITTLNEDAEDVHSLISRSTDELKKATAVGSKIADSAFKIAETLDPLTTRLDTQIDNSARMLKEARAAADEQRLVTSGSISRMEVNIKAATNSLLKEIREERASLNSSAEQTFQALNENCTSLERTTKDATRHLEKTTERALHHLEETTGSAIQRLDEEQAQRFESFSIKSLKEAKETRDELQTDLLTSKTALAARLDNFEGEATKLVRSIEVFKENSSAQLEALRKKMMVPIYASLAVGVVNLICLIVLLIR